METHGRGGWIVRLSWLFLFLVIVHFRNGSIVRFEEADRYVVGGTGRSLGWFAIYETRTRQLGRKKFSISCLHEVARINFDEVLYVERVDCEEEGR